MKNVFITGASGGIGIALTDAFLKNGYRVYSAYNKGEIPETQIRAGAIPVKTDVTDENSVNAAFSRIEKECGGCDVLINNAGIALKQKLLIDVSADEFDEIFKVNVKGAFLTARRALPLMVRNGGIIINVSSVFGLTGGSCEVPYAASKTALIGFTRALSEELFSSGVGVAAICPGLIDTAMNEHLSEQDKKEYLKENGLTRIGSPEDVAEAIIRIVKMPVKEINGRIFSVHTGLSSDMI